MSSRWLLLVLALGACDRSPSTGARSVDPPVGRGAASPNLTGTVDGALLTWVEPIAEEPRSHRVRFARLVGTTWGKPSTIADGAAIVANAADVPSVVLQRDGILVAQWAEQPARPDPHGYDVMLARSVDGGTTWRRLGVPHRDGTDTEHGFVSLLPDEATTLAVWLDGRETARGSTGATALRAASIGESIGDERVLDARVCDCCSTAATMTSEGPIVTYRDRTDDEVRDPSVVQRISGVWSESRTVHPDRWQINACPVNGPAIAAIGRDVAVAWYTDPAHRPQIRVAFSADAGRTFDPAIEVAEPDAAGAPMGRVEVVLDANRDALVSWIASASDSPRVEVRRVARDGRRGPSRELATLTATRDLGVPRLVRAGDTLLVAWTDARGATVRVASLAASEVLAAPRSR